MYIGGHVLSRSFEGACLPQAREAPGKVDKQVEADQFLVVVRVPLDVDIELAYVTVSQGRISRNSMDTPGGISLGKSAVCSITYSPLSTGHWTVAFAFLLMIEPSDS